MYNLIKGDRKKIIVQPNFLNVFRFSSRGPPHDKQMYGLNSGDGATERAS